ncbi:MAG TPA: TonB-dependent receptor plug domain-containing protein [Nitrospiraceae bacterium]|nr:TonB-dependent receptor plug domain-containing protein [Nitrospiraceae bacterium]
MRLSEQTLGPTSQVFEVTAQDILDQNARSVADALRFVPGLFLSVGGGKNPSSATIRGLTVRQTIVFIDGRPVYDPFFGDVDLNNLPIDNVDKIKVVKGPVDAAYGPNAIGSVINIVTKRGTAVPTTRLTASYESHNTQDYWLQHGGRKGGFNYFLAGSYRRSNGFPLASDFQPTPVQPTDVRENAAYEKGNLSLNLGYDFSQTSRIAFQAGYYSADLENPVNINLQSGGRLGGGLTFTNFPTWKRQYLDLYGTTRLFDRLELRGNVYYDRFSNDLVFYPNQLFSQYTDISRDRNDVYGTNLQAAYDLTKQFRLKAGTFLKQDNIDFESLGQAPGNTYYHQVNSRLTYQSPVGLSGFLQLSYIDGSPFTNADFSPGRLPTYTNFVLLNGKLMYEVRKGLKPYLAFENLLDSDYARNPGFPEPDGAYSSGCMRAFEVEEQSMRRFSGGGVNEEGLRPMSRRV